MGRAADSRTRPGIKGRIKPLAKKFVLFIIVLSILYIVIIQALHFTRLKMVETSPLDIGELKKTYPAEGILIRDEAVIPSPADGQLVMLVKQGERVRAGQSIAEVKTAGADPGIPEQSALVRATRTGVVIFGVDGLEGVLKPGQPDLFNADKLDFQDEKTVKDSSVESGVKCSKGEPLLKIVDNLAPLVICIRSRGVSEDVVKKGSNLILTWEGYEINGRVVEIGNYDGGMQLVVESVKYPPELLEKRKISLQLVADRYFGFVVSSKSLVTRKDQEGLYIMVKERFNWVPVEVKLIQHDSAAVAGESLGAGVRYVQNPYWLLFAGD